MSSTHTWFVGQMIMLDGMAGSVMFVNRFRRIEMGHGKNTV